MSSIFYIPGKGSGDLAEIEASISSLKSGQSILHSSIRSLQSQLEDSTPDASPDTIVRRDAAGRVAVAAPTLANQAVNKGYVDSVATGTSDATANTIVRRDANADAKFRQVIAESVSTAGGGPMLRVSSMMNSLLVGQNSAPAGMTTAENTTAVGNASLNKLESGNNNTTVGAYTMSWNFTGGDNTAVGHMAGNSVQGSGNTLIGKDADVSATDATNATAIGKGAVASSNEVRLGNNDVTSVSTAGVVTAGGFSTSGNISGNVSGTALSTIASDVTSATSLRQPNRIVKRAVDNSISVGKVSCTGFSMADGTQAEGNIMTWQDAGSMAVWAPPASAIPTSVVLNKPLTGFVEATTEAPVQASDSIVGAFGKVAKSISSIDRGSTEAVANRTVKRDSGGDVYARNVVASNGWVGVKDIYSPFEHLPSAEGAYIGWNTANNDGRTYFVNGCGVRTGGYDWLMTDPDTTKSLMSLNGAGHLTVPSVACTGFSLNNGSQGEGKLLQYSGSSATWVDPDSALSIDRGTTGAVADRIVKRTAEGNTYSRYAMAMNGYVGTSANMPIPGDSIPVGQGSFMGWNREGGSGATTFLNGRGLGQGGFEWLNYNENWGAPTVLMKLDHTGRLVLPLASPDTNKVLTCQDSAGNAVWGSASSLIAGAGVGTFLKDTTTLTWNGAIGGTSQVAISRASWTVTLNFNGFTGTGNGNSIIQSSEMLPSWALPSASLLVLHGGSYSTPCHIIANGVEIVTGRFTVEVGGFVSFSTANAMGLTGVCGIPNGVTVSYMAD